MPLIRTLVVDDSAFVRKTVRDMLSRSPHIDVVGLARDGREALDLVAELKPDVVTCDLTMPILDGLGFVRQQMQRAPVRILVLTASPLETGAVMDALDAGAVDFVQKPSALANQQLLGIADELLEKVKIAAQAPLRQPRTPAPVPTPESVPVVHAPSVNGKTKVDIVVLGISTGGPQALRHLLPQFVPPFPVPLVMVLHMPVGYTAMFAEKLAELSKIPVREAFEGCELHKGGALLAPAGRHLTFQRAPNGTVHCHLSIQPPKPHRPSVDVLFQSAAQTFGARVLGVVMTGMGDDGKEGAAWIKAQGGTILTESKDSCVIYGMPRSVVEAGLSDASVSLDSLAREIRNNV